ncbi:MAG: Gfo/Idh/MocA family oxidoreductase, partial [Planctomycetaceae bacterium]|nr:Gfo/Idh/MocA family oxidoreductase [Planctomycetaceae bacterium]
MSHSTRREFLERSMFATAAAVAATSGVPLLQAQEKQSQSPNERLRVAVLGVRSRGKAHLDAYTKRSDTEVAIVVDVDEVIGQSAVEQLEKSTGKRPQYLKDMRKAFEDKSIDLVSIATPNHWHALATIWAIQAGKDVYVEKPVSHSVSEGRRAVQAARKYSKIVQTGTQCRSTGATKEAVDYVQSGQIGEVKLARGLCYKRRGSIGPRGKYDVPESVDYNLWIGPAEMLPLTRPKLHYDWHWQWNTGNGDLGNQGIHQMDICRWGLGLDGIGNGVLSYGGRFGYEDAGETANTQVCIHDYGDKQIIFEVRGLPTDKLRGANVGVIFYGTKGYVVMTSYTAGAAFDLDGKLVKTFSGGDDHFGNFISAVRSRNPEDLNADIEEGHYSSALCHLGNISMNLGEPVHGQEARERFAGNRESLETFERFSEHLQKNNVDLSKTKLHLGKQ